ncbi:hypothetical protein ACFV9W_00900 [Streptomyces sp. NPDC059897]|uniref:hypothetical protein n=1 Tax=Streptomyces sp. NPDC059897 TaxID=3346994 RepID=UPI0036510425
MAPQHRKPGARIEYGDVAIRQAHQFTASEVIDIDRALAAIAADPTIGIMRIKPEHGGLMWEYRQPGTCVRIIYTMTVRRTVVTVAYFEA